MQTIGYIENFDSSIIENIKNNTQQGNTIKLMMKIVSFENNENLIVIKEIINKLKVRSGDTVFIYGTYKKDVDFFRNNNSLILLVNNGNLLISFDEFYASINENYTKDIIKYTSIENEDDNIILKVP